MHHRRGGAHVNRRKALVHDVARRREIGAAHVDGDDSVGIQGGGGDRQVIDHATVDAQTTAYVARWEEAGQRTGGVDGVLNPNVAQTWHAPDELCAARDVDSVD